MNYIELSVVVPDEDAAEIAMAQLSDWPFDSFCDYPQQDEGFAEPENDENILYAYIKEEEFRFHETDIESFLQGNGYEYNLKTIQSKNWNSVWESNFEPISIDGRCVIRAPFHKADPMALYDLVIMPKMSFGTGHHATTYLMAEAVMESDLTDLEGLDMGSGTGVLAILAVKCGARHLTAIDIDEWAYENCMENIATNRVEGSITPLLGDAALLAGRQFDFILANINRNILLNDMPVYVEALKSGGEILFSGILEADISYITARAESLGLIVRQTRERTGWMMMRCVKQ